jgi:5-methylcytosine-specific restriction endonuclease McrA
METLILTQGYQPHRIVSWQKAITMLFAGKVEVVEEYDEDIRSVSITVKMPAVVRLLRVLRSGRGRVKFSRANVLARDRFACQYCGAKPRVQQLTFDHVTPRSRGGRTSWENIVTACRSCNAKKGNQTPAQGGMRLGARPERPKSLPFVTMHVRIGDGVPDAWRSWVYWQGTIDAS